MWLWSLRRSRLLHKERDSSLAGSLVVWSHPRERRKGPAERAPGRKGWQDTWKMVQLAPCPLAVLHQGLLPLVSQHTHRAMLALVLPRSPSCLGTSPGPSNSSRLPREHAQGKTRPPPSKHIQLPSELLSSTSRLGRTDNNHYLETRDQGHSRAGLGWSEALPLPGLLQVPL